MRFRKLAEFRASFVFLFVFEIVPIVILTLWHVFAHIVMIRWFDIYFTASMSNIMRKAIYIIVCFSLRFLFLWWLSRVQLNSFSYLSLLSCEWHLAFTATYYGGRASDTRSVNFWPRFAFRGIESVHKFIMRHWLAECCWVLIFRHGVVVLGAGYLRSCSTSATFIIDVILYWLVVAFTFFGITLFLELTVNTAFNFFFAHFILFRSLLFNL